MSGALWFVLGYAIGGLTVCFLILAFLRGYDDAYQRTYQRLSKWTVKK